MGSATRRIVLWVAVWALPLGYALYHDRATGDADRDPFGREDGDDVPFYADDDEADDDERPEPTNRLDDVFADRFLAPDHAGLTRELAREPFGRTADELEAAAPALIAWEEGDAPDEAFADVFVTLDWDDDERLARVTFKFATDLEDARDLLARHWGVPRVAIDGDEERRYLWLNPGAGVRAVLGRSYDGRRAELALTAYVSMAELLGHERERLGFERDPLLGASAAEVRERFPRLRSAPDEPELLRLVLPATEYAGGDESVIDLWLEGGVVASVQLVLRCDLHPGAAEAVLAIARDKWGSPTASEGEGEHRALRFAGPPPALLEATLAGDGWTVTIER